MRDNDFNRTAFERQASGTGWFVGIIVTLALLGIGYLVFSANSCSGPEIVCSTTIEASE